MASFGDGLGGLIGGALASNDLSNASSMVNGMGQNFNNATTPFVDFGTSMLPNATQGISNLETLASSGVPQFGSFMKDFNLSPGAQYTFGQSLDAADNSAAARGGLLSGNNLRSRESIANGIVSNDIAQQYGLTLQGNQQQFGQLQSVLGDMFQGINTGLTATGQQAQIAGANIGAQSQIAQAQAKADQGKGSGIGSMFSGIGSAAAKF